MKKAVKKTKPWEEGQPPPDKHAIVRTAHIENVTYQLRFVACGKPRCRKGCANGRPSHGPYWYALVWNSKTGKTQTHYKGKQLPNAEHLLDEPEMNP